jgi:hypothetical protein
LAIVSMPMMVAAPGRLSMTTDWPRSSVILFARIRAITSEPPPGGYGTISLTGRSGKGRAGTFCAKAPDTLHATTATTVSVRCVSDMTPPRYF